MSEPIDTARRNFEREFADIFGHRVSTEHARRLVRGVISDIREPTDAMAEVGREAVQDCYSLEPGEGFDTPPAIPAYQAMIDEVLQ